MLGRKSQKCVVVWGGKVFALRKLEITAPYRYDHSHLKLFIAVFYTSGILDFAHIIQLQPFKSTGWTFEFVCCRHGICVSLWKVIRKKVVGGSNCVENFSSSSFQFSFIIFVSAHQAPLFALKLTPIIFTSHFLHSTDYGAVWVGFGVLCERILATKGIMIVDLYIISIADIHQKLERAHF